MEISFIMEVHEDVAAIVHMSCPTRNKVILTVKKSHLLGKEFVVRRKLRISPLE